MIISKRQIGPVEFTLVKESGRKSLHFLGSVMSWDEVKHLEEFLKSDQSEPKPEGRHKDSFPKFSKETLPSEEPKTPKKKIISKKK